MRGEIGQKIPYRDSRFDTGLHQHGKHPELLQQGYRCAVLFTVDQRPDVADMGVQSVLQV